MTVMRHHFLGLLGAVGCGLVLLAPSWASGQATTPQISIAATPPLLNFNRDPTTITGQLTGLPNVTGVRVTLRAAAFPYRNFNTLARTATDGEGRYTFVVTPPANRQYTVLASSRPRAQSGTVGVLVVRQVTIKVSSGAPKIGSQYRVSGFAYPANDGLRVLLQYQRGADWHTVATNRLFDVGSVRSGYRFKLSAPRRPTRLRVVVTDDGKFVASPSNSRSIRPKR